MKYDFTSIIDRTNKDAIAIDCIGKTHWGFEPGGAKEGFDEIPMWVADMNFATCPSIPAAIQERISHPLFGYFLPTKEYYDSIIKWQTTKNGYTDLTEAEIGYENGVHGCVISTIQSMTQPGDGVFLHTPAYVGFLGDLKETGRYAVTSDLKKDEDGIWRMDFEEMDRVIGENHVRLAIFCSPHNPTGRVWERWELEKAFEIFAKHSCVVISDEIWADIVFEGHKHIPSAMINEDARNRSVCVYAPSKTFNLAGLIGSYHIIFNPVLREKITKFGDKTHYNEMNVLSMHALIGAYKEEGFEWVSELNHVLSENTSYAVKRINDEFHGCHASKVQGTYMVFMDCEEYCKKNNKTLDDVLKAGWDVGVAYQDGRKFAHPWSIRINCALPKSRVEEAFDRLKEYVFV